MSTLSDFMKSPGGGYKSGGIGQEETKSSAISITMPRAGTSFRKSKSSSAARDDMI